MASKTVNLPGFGKVNRTTVIGGAIVIVGGAGYFIYREMKKNQAAAAAAQATTSATGYGYGTSAQYAYGYGSPYGYGAYPTGYYGYGAGPYGEGIGPYGEIGPYYGYGVTEPYGYSTTTAAAPTTNAQWAQAAINQLESEGYNAQTVSAALGAYELGQTVSASDVSIVQAAIGVEGYPPQSGANGYPPKIKTQGTTGGGSGGGQTSTSTKTVEVPNVMNMTGSAAKAAITKAGLTYAQSPTTTPKGKTTKVIAEDDPKAGTKVPAGTTVHVKVSY